MAAVKIPTNTKALIFDMDGILVDSEPVGLDTFIEITKKYACPARYSMSYSKH